MGEQRKMRPKIKCPKCKSDKNIVKLVSGFRCIYCMIEFYNPNGDQTTLNIPSFENN